MRKYFFTICFLIISSNLLQANPMNQEELFRNYVEKHLPLARNVARAEHIPVSICLAQALQESYGGKSTLATKANNHFGIKAADSIRWKGERFFIEDDDRDANGMLRKSAFRKYKCVEDSYKDYAKYLKTSSRYQPLFSIPSTDYRAWAYGIKNAGYATDKAYAENLIENIEKYELYKYDVENPQSAKFDPKPSITAPSTKTLSKSGAELKVLKIDKIKPQNTVTKKQENEKKKQEDSPTLAERKTTWEKPNVAPTCPNPTQAAEPMQAKPTFLTIKLRDTTTPN